MARTVLTVAAVLLGVALLVSAFGSGSGLAWWHLLGLAASVAVLAGIWFWPSIRQPRRPPP
jgi:hypothetical protein